MITGPKDYLKLGDWNAICDSCGFKFKASELRKRWDGFMVCDEDYEPRHPQDLIRVVKDGGAAPWVRLPQYVFIEAGYYAFGEYYADGSISATGSGVENGLASELFVTFGPVDPDSL